MTEPRWTLADGTEVGIGDTVWQVGKCLSRRVTGRARFHNGLNHVAVDGNRQKFFDLGEVALADLFGSRRAAMEETVKRLEKDRRRFQSEMRKAEKAIAAIRAELRAQEELEVSR